MRVCKYRLGCMSEPAVQRQPEQVSFADRRWPRTLGGIWIAHDAVAVKAAARRGEECGGDRHARLLDRVGPHVASKVHQRRYPHACAASRRLEHIRFTSHCLAGRHVVRMIGTVEQRVTVDRDAAHRAVACRRTRRVHRHPHGQGSHGVRLRVVALIVTQVSVPLGKVVSGAALHGWLLRLIGRQRPSQTPAVDVGPNLYAAVTQHSGALQKPELQTEQQPGLVEHEHKHRW
mmetsp:Transcript_47697/g.136697  ORF Transcript_47697/g.136697 Transcript_47697/m.136697 type:complete len:232 (+) Transcript_47697:66-761(+)